MRMRSRPDTGPSVARSATEEGGEGGEIDAFDGDAGGGGEAAAGLVFGGGGARVAFAGDLDRDDAPRRVDVEQAARQDAARGAVKTQADGGRFAQQRLADGVAGGGCAQGRYGNGRTRLLHDDGGEPGVEGAGGEESVDERLAQLGVHIVDVGFDDDDLVFGGAAGGGGGGEAGDDAQEVGAIGELTIAGAPADAEDAQGRQRAEGGGAGGEDAG